MLTIILIGILLKLSSLCVFLTNFLKVYTLMQNLKVKLFFANSLENHNILRTNNFTFIHPNFIILSSAENGHLLFQLIPLKRRKKSCWW